MAQQSAKFISLCPPDPQKKIDQFAKPGVTPLTELEKQKETEKNENEVVYGEYDKQIGEMVKKNQEAEDQLESELTQEELIKKWGKLEINQFDPVDDLKIRVCKQGKNAGRPCWTGKYRNGSPPMDFFWWADIDLKAPPPRPTGTFPTDIKCFQCQKGKNKGSWYWSNFGGYFKWCESATCTRSAMKKAARGRKKRTMF